MTEREPKPWERLETRPGKPTRIFTVRHDRMRNPRNGAKVDAVILEAPDWVNVVALTFDGKIVTVRQYRFGVGAVTTEIPAGMVDPGETHADAARRELLEETGYRSDQWQYLGYVEPNPAFLDNRCHHWLAREASRCGDPSLDAGEDVSVQERTLDELRREIAAGRMRHSLAVSALAHVFDIFSRA